MITPTPLADGTPTGYGLGLFPGTFGGHRAISHEGNVSGFSSALLHFIDDDLRIAMITNHRSMRPPWALVAQHVLAIGPAKEVPIDVAQLRRYEVSVPTFDGTTRVFVDGNHLAWAYVDKDGKQQMTMPLVHVGGHAFEVADRTAGIVFRVENERVVESELIVGGISLFTRY